MDFQIHPYLQEQHEEQKNVGGGGGGGGGLPLCIPNSLVNSIMKNTCLRKQCITVELQQNVLSCWLSTAEEN
jgi:hypothetical protein